MIKVQEIKDQVDKSLTDESKPWTPIFALLESKTGVKRSYLFSGFVGFVVLYLIFGYAAQLVCNIIGFVYPAYCSIRALESPNKEDDTKWLTYWTVFAFLSIIEFPSEIILRVIPVYWLLKCIFFIWCYLPIENNGSIILYRRLVRPMYLKYQNNIEDVTSKLTSQATKYIAKNLFEDGKKGE
nr:PREDICTED: receptor expression-enhancing protein 5-like [Bemisia tabaci]